MDASTRFVLLLPIGDYLSHSCSPFPHRLQLCAAFLVCQGYQAACWAGRPKGRRLRPRTHRCHCDHISWYRSKSSTSNGVAFGLTSWKLSTVRYQQSMFKTLTMFRGAMVTLVFDHSVALSDHMNAENAAVSHMSTGTLGVEGKWNHC